MKDIEKKVFQLSTRERAILARNIIRSLENEEEEEDENAEALWIAEADRRYQELKSGIVKGIPAVQIFDAARKRL